MLKVIFVFSCFVSFGLHSIALAEDVLIPPTEQSGGASVVKVTCMTAKCHETLLQGAESIHKPLKAKGCTVCHKLGRGDLDLPEKHPQILPIKKEKINPSCLACHDEFEATLKRGKFVHKPIQEKGCISCHDPHASKYENLLKENAAPELCYSCHKDVRELKDNEKLFEAHATEEKGCFNCHESHVSSQEKLLKTTENNLCLKCHSDLIEGKIAHSSKVTCAKCHNPHGGEYDTLLRKKYSQQFYAEVNDRAYELCFECHKQEFATQETTTSATEFRNGSKNLHYLHFHARNKGKNCRVCHAVHEAPQPKLLQRWVAFGAIKLPMQFTKTENGGTCLTACHKNKSYDRVNGVINETGK